MSTSAFASPVPVLPVTGATRLATGGLFIATAVLSFAPIAVLGPAIGWPASLRAPAAQQLAMIGGAPDAVALGYGIYLLCSLLVLPVMVLLALRVSGSLARPLAMLVVTLAALSVLARCIGILRWLTVMPALANQHAVADPGQKKVIETVFLALTNYGGSIGEILGVSLFMALSLGLATITALVNKTLPAWLAGCMGPGQRAAFVGLVVASAGYRRADSHCAGSQHAIGLDAGCRHGAGLAARPGITFRLRLGERSGWPARTLCVSDPARMLGRIQMRQRVVGHQHVALGRKRKFGHRAIANAQVQLNGGFGRCTQHLSDSS